MNWKLIGGFAAFGALISLVAGIAGGNPFGIVLLRLVLSAFVSALLGAGVVLALRRFVPELLGRAPAPAEPGAGAGDVDIVIDEEIPLDGESLLGEGPAPALRTVSGGREGDTAGAPAAPSEQRSEGGPELGPDLGLELGPEEEVADLEAPSDTELDGGLEVLEGEPPPQGADASWPSASEDVGALDSLPELEQPSGGGEAAGEARAGGRRGSGRPGGKPGGKLEESVAGQDPASLAKAVRTFLRKDQEG